MSKSSLILEGGGLRGLYTAGVLDYLMEQEFYTDAVFGVSAGACNACSYASHQIKRSYRINIGYIRDKRYMSVRSLIKTGDLFNAVFAYDTIPNELDPFDYDTFNRYGMKLYAVCSNLESGKAEYIPCINMKHDVIYVRASASLPLLSRIVEVDGKKLLDGGCCDSIPIKRSVEMGYDKNIVILTRDHSYRKGKNNLMPLIKKTYKKYPAFIKANENRHIVYNRTLDELNVMQKEGKAFIIQPSVPVEISRLEKNVTKLKELYQLGYEDAKKVYPKLQEYMKGYDEY